MTTKKWEISHHDDNDELVIRAENGDIIANMECDKGDYQTDETVYSHACLIRTSPELLNELVTAHLIINRLVEEIHKVHTKSNNIVERIKWPMIRELDRKNVIAKAKNR